MKFKDFINNVLFYISVPKCASCGRRLDRDDKALCKTCKIEYTDAKMTDCSLCAKRTDECECSTKYLKAHFIHKLIKVYRYIPETEPPTNQLIYRLKRDNRADIREFLKDELLKSINNKGIDYSEFIITNIPRRRASVKKYGFDHTKELAKLLCKETGIKYVSLLNSCSKKDQKKNKTREQRIANAQFTYRKRMPDISGKSVFLLDDIVTTGASLGTAATLIHGLGAKKIVGLTVAIAYKDDYTPFQYTEL